MTPLRTYLAHALADAGVVELRQLGNVRRSGLYDNAGALEAAILDISRKSTVYTTLNRPVGRSATNAMDDRALTDAEIGVVTRIPFDFDSVRPKGQNAADGELAAACERRDRFVASMTARGWPMPLTATSGNGAHALFRCRFKATPELRDKFDTVYRTLAGDHSDEHVDFDVTVRNPSRIWRIYGTRNLKNPATPGRPQRMATCRFPSRWECVSPAALDRLADACARRNVQPERPAVVRVAAVVEGKGDYRTLDAVAWFTARGCYKRPIPGRKHAVVCPWRGEHSEPLASLLALDTSTVVFDADGGWPVFHCSHAHCAGRRMTDVMALWGDADRYCAREWRRP